MLSRVTNSSSLGEWKVTLSKRAITPVSIRDRIKDDVINPTLLKRMKSYDRKIMT